MVEVIGKGRPFELDVKRFCVGGVKLRSKCPKCGKVITRDLGEEYLSYPTVNTPIEVDFCHEAPSGEPTDHEWSEKIVLRVTIEPAPKVRAKAVP